VTKHPAVILLAALILVTGCSKKDASTPAATPAAGAAAAVPGAAAAAAKPVPAQLPEVVARVNGDSVTKTELEMAVRTLEERARQSVPPEQRDQVFRQVLDRIIGYHLLVQESKTRNVVAPPWEVDGQIDQIKKQFPNDTAFQEMLKSRGVTLDKLRTDASQTIAVNKMLETELEPKLQVADADTKAFYEQNKPKFRQEDSVHASHILIRADQKADAATKAKAKAQASDVLAQLKQGAAFGDLAKKFSQDPGSAQNGGDLGFFSKGQMVPAFETAAFGLKPGQTSGIVESPFGYHIIKTIEFKAGRDVPYEEAKPQIADYLKQQLREKKSQEFVDGLKSKGKVEILI
jgi:peptidyl-prolyl cis-trans isomerase C